MRSALPLLLCAITLACGGQQKPLGFEGPGALPLAPSSVLVEPPPGPFNGEVTITLKAARAGAKVYVSTDGRDPRTSSQGRLSGTSVSVTLAQSGKLRYFAGVRGEPDGELLEGEWVRAGGPVGTISGTLVVGAYATGKALGLSRNGTVRELAPTSEPIEIPFHYSGLATGTYRLRGLADRNDDGFLLPVLDYEGDSVNVELNRADPFKAGPENVRVYLGASKAGLGTLAGIIHLPKPPPFQQLRIAVLSASDLAGDPNALLQKLQTGYQVFTNAVDTEYPYVITDLTPGQYTPVPALIGFGNGGLAFNLLANPLRQVTIIADQTTYKDFAFGPVAISGTVTIGPDAGVPSSVVNLGVVAGRTLSLNEGVQAVLMPVLFSGGSTMTASYGGSAFRGNTSVSLRVFPGATGIVSALTWVINPLSGEPANATVSVGTDDVVQDITLP